MSKSKQPRHPGIHLHKTSTIIPVVKSAKAYKHRVASHVKKVVVATRVTQYYWNLIASNGRIIAHSETYTRKRNAINSIRVAADVFRFEYDGKYYENGEVKQIVNEKKGKG